MYSKFSRAALGKSLGANTFFRTFGHSPIGPGAQRLLWDGGKMPYLVDEGKFDDAAKAVIREAVRKWNQYFLLYYGVFVVPRIDEKNTIVINTDPKVKDSGGLCNSKIGSIGGSQSISCLPEESVSVHTILHELGHSAGLDHEHQRRDRDRVITVSTTEVGSHQGRNQQNFQRDYGVSSNSFIYGEYDLASVMHYSLSEGSADYTEGANTLAVAFQLNSVHTLPSAQRTQINLMNRIISIVGKGELSYGDIQTLSTLYPSPGWNIPLIPISIYKSNGKQLVAFDPSGQWACMLREYSGPSPDLVEHLTDFRAIWVGSNWVQPLALRGKTGWQLRPGDNFMRADINKDERDEIIVVSKNGNRIGVLYETDSAKGWDETDFDVKLNAGWVTKDRVDGWVLNEGDRFFSAAINERGRDCIIVVQGAGKLVGVMRGLNNSYALTTSWITPQEGKIGGWDLNHDDNFLVADIDGDGKDEIIVTSKAGANLGILKENGYGLTATWITHSQIGAWELKPGDKFIAATSDNTGRKIVIVSREKGDRIGILKDDSAGKLTCEWKRDTQIDGWTLSEHDTFFAADIDGDGKDEIFVSSGNGKMLGIMRQVGNGLETIHIHKNSIDNLDTTNAGWLLSESDRFMAIDLSGAGKKELIVINKTGRKMGVLTENSERLALRNMYFYDQPQPSSSTHNLMSSAFFKPAEKPLEESTQRSIEQLSSVRKPGVSGRD